MVNGWQWTKKKESPQWCVLSQIRLQCPPTGFSKSFKSLATGTKGHTSTWTKLKPARKKKFALTRFKKKSDNGQNINVTRNKANRNTRANERKISEKSVEKAQIKEIDYEIIGSSTNVTKIVGPDGKNTTTIEKTMTKNDVEDMRMNKVTDEENENIDFNIKDLKSHMESILKDFHKNDYEDTGNITQNKKYIKYGPNGDKVTTIKKTIVHNDEDYDEEEYKEV